MVSLVVQYFENPPKQTYLQNHSLHQPAQRLSAWATLVDRAKKITDADLLQEELGFSEMFSYSMDLTKLM